MDILTFDNLIRLVVGIIAIAYVIYTLIRAHSYWEEGVKETLIGWRRYDLRLYHIIWFIIDIPAVFIGRIYHVFARIFSVKLYTFAKPEQENKDEVNQ